MLSRGTVQVSGKRPTHMQNGQARFFIHMYSKTCERKRVSFARFSIVMHWHKFALSAALSAIIIIVLKIPKIPSPNGTDLNLYNLEK